MLLRASGKSSLPEGQHGILRWPLAGTKRRGETETDDEDRTTTVTSNEPRTEDHDAGTQPGGAEPRAAWLPWLAWGWILLLVLAAAAELLGWADLRLALDFQRHFR